MQKIVVDKDEDKRLREELHKRTDPEARRIERFLSLPDLSRTPGSPIHEVVERVTALADFNGFDFIEVPEIVPADISFDLFDFPTEHPARSKSDTYYVDSKNNVTVSSINGDVELKTHNWKFYVNHNLVRTEDINKIYVKSGDVIEAKYQ